jgi:hypothetical protein
MCHCTNFIFHATVTCTYHNSHRFIHTEGRKHTIYRRVCIYIHINTYIVNSTIDCGISFTFLQHFFFHLILFILIDITHIWQLLTYYWCYWLRIIKLVSLFNFSLSKQKHTSPRLQVILLQTCMSLLRLTLMIISFNSWHDIAANKLSSICVVITRFIYMHAWFNSHKNYIKYMRKLLFSYSIQQNTIHWVNICSGVASNWILKNTKLLLINYTQEKYVWFSREKIYELLHRKANLESLIYAWRTWKPRHPYIKRMGKRREIQQEWMFHFEPTTYVT